MSSCVSIVNRGTRLPRDCRQKQPDLQNKCPDNFLHVQISVRYKNHLVPVRKHHGFKKTPVLVATETLQTSGVLQNVQRSDCSVPSVPPAPDVMRRLWFSTNVSLSLQKRWLLTLLPGDSVNLKL